LQQIPKVKHGDLFFINCTCSGALILATYFKKQQQNICHLSLLKEQLPRRQRVGLEAYPQENRRKLGQDVTHSSTECDTGILDCDFAILKNVSQKLTQQKLIQLVSTQR